MLNKFILTTILIFTFFITLGYAAPENNTTTPENNITATLRIMPLGDSITHGVSSYEDLSNPQIGGYRKFLWYMLQDANISVDFVGSESSGQGIKPSIDPDHEGHFGWTILDIANITYETMAQNQPNIVLLHIGTNDNEVTDPKDINQILDAIDRYERDSGKTIRVMVALIIDKQTPDTRIDIFNQNLKKLLEERILNGDRLQIIDMYKEAGLSSADYANNLHPNDSGYWKMANVWFHAIIAPYHPALRTFPTTLVPSSYIKNIAFDDAQNSVSFTTEVPNTGIIF